MRAEEIPSRLRAGTVLAYLLMIVATVAALASIRSLGSTLRPSEAVRMPVPAPPPSGEGDDLFHVLLALAVIIVAARLLGAVFRYFRQPPVIGEVVAGILLGPSFLGRVLPAAADFILPAQIAPFLRMLAQLGVILFMFTVGLQLDTTLIRRRTHAMVAISHASIIVPLLLGSAFALWLYPRFADAGVPFDVFYLFLGVAMSVTAFPVLARILTDRRIHATGLGVTAISCAAVGDVTAWCLLAFVVSFAEARVSNALSILAQLVTYVGAMLIVVRSALRRLALRFEARPQGNELSFSVLMLTLLLSAIATESIGIHALFGAFFAGALVPHDSALARAARARIEELVVVLLLPAFFAFTGMRTEFGLLDSAFEWLTCAAIIAIACAGKFGGTFAASRLMGLSWRDSASLGILMNTRGLMEIVVLNIGLDLGVLSRTVFAMMVLMALVTTVATSPILDLLTREGPLTPGGAELPPSEREAVETAR